MNKIQKIIKYVSDKDYNFWIDTVHGKYDDLSDEEFLKAHFRIVFNSELDLENPKTFNEKLQWLKLHDRNPLYTTLVDKVNVKHYISKSIGEEYVIPTIGIWDSFDEINLNVLPDRFAIKCSHDSGTAVIVKDKNKYNFQPVRQKLEKSLNRNYYKLGREWPYKDVTPRIIAEKYMQDAEGIDELTDYKFYCFNGYVDCVMACIGRSTGKTKFYFFDSKWNLKRINKAGIAAPKNFTINKPDRIEEMFELASELSKGIPFVRVDLYECGSNIFFGEMTFFPQGGFDANYLPETDLYFGSLIDFSIAYENKKGEKQ